METGDVKILLMPNDMDKLILLLVPSAGTCAIQEQCLIRDMTPGGGGGAMSFCLLFAEVVRLRNQRDMSRYEER